MGILELPNELLAGILQEERAVRPMAMTCWSLYQRLMPLLYSTYRKATAERAAEFCLRAETKNQQLEACGALAKCIPCPTRPKEHTTYYVLNMLVQRFSGLSQEDLAFTNVKLGKFADAEINCALHWESIPVLGVAILFDATGFIQNIIKQHTDSGPHNLPHLLYEWLYFACDNGKLEAVSTLLEEGADPNRSPDSEFHDRELTPLELALVRDNEKLVERLLDGGAKPTSLSLILSAGSRLGVTIANTLLKDGLRVDVSIGGFSPIMESVKLKNTELIQLLLENFDASLVHNHGWTLLIMATFTGCKTIFDMIIKHVTASQTAEFLETTDKIGRTALMYACSLGYSDLASDLIDRYEVRVDQKDHFGNCALALAISAGLSTVIPKLEAKLPIEDVQRIRKMSMDSATISQPVLHLCNKCGEIFVCRNRECQRLGASCGEGGHDWRTYKCKAVDVLCIDYNERHSASK